MAFRSKTHTHSQEANIAIGRGQLTGPGMYGTNDSGPDSRLRTPMSKPTLSTQKSMEQEQRFEDVAPEGGASPYFQPY
jgi:hypothetical protein